MIRTFAHERVEEMARFASIPVINGLSDLLHPCQILSDIFTITEKRGDEYRGLKVAYVGDGNNVANSWINGAVRLGFELSLACPPGYGPDEKILARAQAEGGSRIILTHDPQEAVEQAHVINTDVWASMGQEKERAKRSKAFQGYQVNADLVRHARARLSGHALPSRPSGGGDHRRGTGGASVSGLRSGGEPSACTKGHLDPLAGKRERTMHKDINKIVLAYSGGLDTSVILQWLKEQYGVRGDRLLRRRRPGQGNRRGAREGHCHRREQGLYRGSHRGVRARLRLPPDQGQRRL